MEIDPLDVCSLQVPSPVPIVPSMDVFDNSPRMVIGRSLDTLPLLVEALTLAEKFSPGVNVIEPLLVPKSIVFAVLAALSKAT